MSLYKRKKQNINIVIHLEEISKEELAEHLQNAHIDFIRQVRESLNFSDKESELLNQCLTEKV